jgi:hypothetical protein
VANKSVAAVVDGQRPQTGYSQHLAPGQEAPADSMSLEPQAVAMGLEGTDERIGSGGPLFAPSRLPGNQVGQTAAVPPERHTAGFMALCGLTAKTQVRTGNVHDHVVQLQRRDLGNAQSAAARKAKDDQVPMVIVRLAGLAGGVSEHGGQFAAGQQSAWSRFQGVECMAVLWGFEVREPGRPGAARPASHDGSLPPDCKRRMTTIWRNWGHFRHESVIVSEKAAQEFVERTGEIRGRRPCHRLSTSEPKSGSHFPSTTYHELGLKKKCHDFDPNRYHACSINVGATCPGGIVRWRRSCSPYEKS